MSYRLMFMINSVLAAVAGLALLLSPKSLFDFFYMAGGGDTLSHILLARFYGGTLIVIAALLWFLQDTKKETMKTESFAMMVLSLAGAAMIVMDLMAKQRILQFYSWILLLIYLALAAGYAYLVFGVTVKVKSRK
jgi:hypothetical protein